MLERKKSMVLAGLTIILLVSECNRQPNDPSADKVAFTLNLKSGDASQAKGLIRIPLSIQKKATTLKKALDFRSVDMARVLVINLSKYSSLEDLQNSDEWKAYSRDVQTVQRDYTVWGEWTKLISTYFPIAADQALQLQGDYWSAKVAGAIGMNDILVALLEKGKMHYLGEVQAWGTEGTTQVLDVPVIDVTNWDTDGDGGQASVSYIAIKPDSALLFNNQTTEFKCIAHYSSGGTDTLTNEATWSLSPGILGTINSNGIFQAGSSSDGNEKVIVSFGGKKDTSEIKLIKGSPGDMVLIPAGSFTMGKTTLPGASDYTPSHTVTLNAFYIDRFEVTCAQYAAFLNAALAAGTVQISSGNVVKGANILTKATSNFQLDYVNGLFKVKTGINTGIENQAIGQISWWGADAYAKHYGKRLPTEAEWEKAARGADAREYPWGNATATGYYYNVSYSIKPVGQFHPQGDSPYGLSDMAGNIYEWTNDWYNDTYYASSPSTNPQGPSTGTERVLRGGSVFYLTNYFVVCYDRARSLPEYTNSDYGFRCAKNP